MFKKILDGTCVMARTFHHSNAIVIQEIPTYAFLLKLAFSNQRIGDSPWIPFFGWCPEIFLLTLQWCSQRYSYNNRVQLISIINFHVHGFIFQTHYPELKNYLFIFAPRVVDLFYSSLEHFSSFTLPFSKCNLWL